MDLSERKAHGSEGEEGIHLHILLLKKQKLPRVSYCFFLLADIPS